jgi:hypothetical protein
VNAKVDGMMWAAGWFAINAYTGEVWDTLEEKRVDTKAIKKRRDEVLARTGGLIEINRKYLRLSFYALEGLLKDPCTEKPPKNIPQRKNSP